VALPAFARRAAAAPPQQIDISCPPGAQQQTRPANWTDRETGGRTPDSCIDPARHITQAAATNKTNITRKCLCKSVMASSGQQGRRQRSLVSLFIPIIIIVLNFALNNETRKLCYNCCSGVLIYYHVFSSLPPH